jgi:glycosyltransferase involved in cell wall biosynthesis
MSGDALEHRSASVTEAAPREGEQGRAAGVNLVGLLRAENGIGEAARKIAVGLEQAGIPYSTIAYAKTVARQQHPLELREGGPLYGTNIISLNPTQLQEFAVIAGADLFAGRYSIGVWYCETTVLPVKALPGFHFVDEVWAASEFVRDIFARYGRVPVFVVPLPIDKPAPPVPSREDVGFPDAFTFLFSFDFQSGLERKNPYALVEAFRRAFASGEGPLLVLKSINGDRKRRALEQLRAAVADRPDIQVRDGYVSAQEKDAMMAHSDCYVSLHRSEGLGLTMAEAMSYGTPVIATGYSGNMEFMDEANSYLVPFELREIPKDAYSSSGIWADPDIDAAAALMRRVYEHQDEARALGEHARQDILERCSPERTGRFVARRLCEIEERRARLAQFGMDDPIAPIVHAAAVLGARPGGALQEAARGRGPTALLRRILLRAIWPYVAEQHRISTGLLEAATALRRSRDDALDRLGELERRLAGDEPAELSTPRSDSKAAEPNSA